MSNNGYFVIIYVLFDIGSEEIFFLKIIFDRFGLEVNNCNILVVCILLGEFLVKVG